MKKINYSNNADLIEIDLDTLDDSIHNLKHIQRKILEESEYMKLKYQKVESHLGINGKIENDLNYAIEMNIQRTDEAIACIESMISSLKIQIKLIKNEVSADQKDKRSLS